MSFGGRKIYYDNSTWCASCDTINAVMALRCINCNQRVRHKSHRSYSKRNVKRY